MRRIDRLTSAHVHGPGHAWLTGRRGALRGTAAAALAGVLGACTEVAGSGPAIGPEAVRGRRPDGTVQLRMVRAAYIGSAGAGSGTLEFRGRRYPFNITGGGIGGIGAAEIEASGEVYGLREVSQFPGAYAEARTGAALGTVSTGELWLQNEAGVIMRLAARQQGLMLSLGADAMVIALQ